MSVKIVVAKYNENVDWIKNIRHPVVVYDKSDTPMIGSIPLKNVGREGETFLRHIVNNYDKLDDVTVFLQGNPFEHLNYLVGWRTVLTHDEKQKVINKINNDISSNSIFSSFYCVLHNVPNGTNGANAKEDCIKYFNEKREYFTVSMGAQYIVPKENILSTPLFVWKKMHEDIYYGILNGYSMEILWYFSFTGKVNYLVGNHDQVKEKHVNNNLLQEHSSCIFPQQILHF
jgi:hypothetical protein